MKSGDWGKSKLMSSTDGDFVPTGKGMGLDQPAPKEMGERGPWSKWLPAGEKGPGVKGVSGGGAMKGSGGSLGGKSWPDGERGWVKGV
jgi:hypothetical protein